MEKNTFIRVEKEISIDTKMPNYLAAAVEGSAYLIKYAYKATVTVDVVAKSNSLSFIIVKYVGPYHSFRQAHDFILSLIPVIHEN